jgi:hypothetical protein
VIAMLDLPTWDYNQEREKNWRRSVPVLGLSDEAVVNPLFRKDLSRERPNHRLSLCPLCPLWFPAEKP